MLEESQLSEIEITEGEESIRLSRGAASAGAPRANRWRLSACLSKPRLFTLPNRRLPLRPRSHEPDTAGTVNSPMVGTFYASPNPDSNPMSKSAAA